MIEIAPPFKLEQFLKVLFWIRNKEDSELPENIILLFK